MRAGTAALLLTAVAGASAVEVTIETLVEIDDDDCERRAASGDRIHFHYTGRIANESETGVPWEQFDSSVTAIGMGMMPKQMAGMISPMDIYPPAEVQLGAGGVIAGLEKGLLGMCVGELREIIIPPEFAYGDEGGKASVGDKNFTIPGRATLHFAVSCKKITDGSTEAPNIFAKLDANQDAELTKDEVEEFFQRMEKKSMPTELWDNEDKDKDGIVSWEEFSGPKGSDPRLKNKKKKKRKRKKKKKKKKEKVSKQEDTASGKEEL